MAQMLSGLRDAARRLRPALHPNDSVWERWRVEPLGLRELLQESDAVCVQLPYFSRYRGLLGERFLPFCRPDQVIVSISHSALFDEVWLADALASDRLATVWLDSVEPGLLDPGRPLRSRRCRSRRAWLARRARRTCAAPGPWRIDELLRPEMQAESA